MESVSGWLEAYMHKLSYFRAGIADCCRIDLHNGKKLLFDYACLRSADGPMDQPLDLRKTLREDLRASRRNGYDVVTFTHLDDDRAHGASEFFWFDHALKYQGQDRAKIAVLWVPAAVLLEKDLTGDDRVIQIEARCRFRRKAGIRVFSCPDRLRAWIEDQGLRFDDYRHLVTDGGQIVPGFTKEADGAEFLVRSPSAERTDGAVTEPNDSSLIMQATFVFAGRETRLVLGPHSKRELWDKDIGITSSDQRAAC
jgi:hypothetical protein